MMFMKARQGSGSASSARKRAGALLMGLLMLGLGGCASRQAESPDFQVTLVESADWERYRDIIEDDGIPLTRAELAVLFSSSEIDRNLSTAQMAEVQKYFKHYLHNSRPMLERFLQRSNSYMAHTTKVFKDRGMPEELACLAFVESGYNPMAVSRSGATGLWQFMPATGRHYGLAQDWWMDERNDPYRSTHAAADYLAKLYGDFKDWHLALAAYNAGEGKISRALAGTGTRNFFDLVAKNHLLDDKAQLRDETKAYVPRFLAMSKIMRNAQALGLSPASPRADSQVLAPAAQLTAPPGTDLLGLALALNMSWEEFSAYNPAYRRYISPLDRPAAIYVPHYAKDRAQLAVYDKKVAGPGWRTVKVGKGETPAKISARTGVPVAALRQANPGHRFQAGSQVKLPGAVGMNYPVVAAAEPASRAPSKTNPVPPKNSVQAKPASAPAPAKTQTVAAKGNPVPPASYEPVPPATGRSGKNNAAPAKASANSTAAAKAPASHKVQSGDTLASISRTYGVAMNDIVAANPGLNPDKVILGQTLRIPAPGSVKSSAAAKQAAPKVTTYKVEEGDTMWAIARKFNLPPTELLAFNNMDRSVSLQPGDFVKVPKVD